jgi:acyl carrier protein
MPDKTRAAIVALLTEASDRDVDPTQITEATTLRDDLALDSMQAIHLCLDLETQFGITVDDEKIRDLKTVGDVFSLVEASLEA